MTRWSPDTCGCVIEYDDKIKHTETIQACRKHAGLTGQEHLDSVLTHNRNKNYVVAHLLASGLKEEEIAVGYDPDAKIDKLTIVGSTPAATLKIGEAVKTLSADLASVVKAPT